MSEDLRRVVDEEEVTYSWRRKPATVAVASPDIENKTHDTHVPKTAAIEAQKCLDPCSEKADTTSGEALSLAQGRTNSHGAAITAEARPRSQGRPASGGGKGSERFGSQHGASGNAQTKRTKAKSSPRISFGESESAVAICHSIPSKRSAEGGRSKDKTIEFAIDIDLAAQQRGQRRKLCAERPQFPANIVAYDGGKTCLATRPFGKMCGKPLLQWSVGEMSSELVCLHIDEWTQAEVTWPEVGGGDLQSHFGLIAGMLVDPSLKRAFIVDVHCGIFSDSPGVAACKAAKAVIEIGSSEGGSLLVSEVEHALTRLESLGDSEGPGKRLEAGVQRELLRLLWADTVIENEQSQLCDAWLLQQLARSPQDVKQDAQAASLAALREQNDFLDAYLFRLLRLKRALATLLDKWEKVDYYGILGVSPSATDKELKNAYRKACLRLHPDKGGDKDLFQQLQNAYAQVLEERAKSSQKAGGDGPGSGTDVPSKPQGRKSERSTSNDNVAKGALSLENAPVGKDSEDIAPAAAEVILAEQQLTKHVKGIQLLVASAERAEGSVRQLKKEKGCVEALATAQEAGDSLLKLSEEIGRLGPTLSEAAMEVSEASLTLAARFAMVPSSILLTDVAMSCAFEASRIEHAAGQMLEIRRDTVTSLQTLSSMLSMARIIGKVDDETFKMSLGLVAKAATRIIASVRAVASAVRDAAQRGCQCKVHARGVVHFASGRTTADLDAEDDVLYAALPAPEECPEAQKSGPSPNPEPDATPTSNTQPTSASRASPHDETDAGSAAKPNEWAAAVHHRIQNDELFRQMNTALFSLQQRARAHLAGMGKAQYLAGVLAEERKLLFQLVGEILLAATDMMVAEITATCPDKESMESLLARHFSFVEVCGTSLAAPADLRAQLVKVATLLDAQAVLVALEKEVKPRIASQCREVVGEELQVALSNVVDRRFEMLCAAIVAARLV
jgi:hypothetical protein